jgi:hypothetical protein
MDASSVFTQLPCLCCESPRRERLMMIIGEVYLRLERGEQVQLPTRDQLFSACCRADLNLTPTMNVLAKL